jgi:hypothetical protein
MYCICEERSKSSRPIPQTSHQVTSIWLLPKLKMGLRGRRFATVEDIKENADARLRPIKKKIFVNVTTTG